jgi:pimeloyl-ACP methyl ester carboxylesterase
MPENGFPITLETEDGLELVGFVFQPEVADDKHIGLLLAHENGSNYHSWDPLVETFTKMGFTVLAFDFRGFGGSDGRSDFSSLGMDIAPALDFLQGMGFDRIVCMGSSMGGTACLEATMGFEFSGLGLISTPMNIAGSGITKRKDLEKIKIPKLVIQAENDFAEATTPGFVADVLRMYKWMSEPKQLFLDPGYSHGVTVLLGSDGEAALEVLLAFLQSLL